MHNPFTVLMNCLMFKAVKLGMFIRTFTNLNTNACDEKKFMLKIFSVLPVITHYEYQFCFHDMYFTVVYVSVMGVSVAVHEIFVHMDIHLSNR